MPPRVPIAWAILGLFGLAGLFGLHHLGLWLERRGWLYYRDRKRGGISGGFAAFQEAIDPSARHVEHVMDERRAPSDDQAPGDPDAPPPPIEFGNSDHARADGRMT